MEDNAINLYEEFKKLWKLCCMKPHKWLSNSRKVLGQIPIEEDTFTFLPKNVHNDFNYTKRNLLKKISSLFDPLGLLAPFTIRSKLLMQENWSAGID